MKHIFIANPVAGGGKLEKGLLPKLYAFLRESDIDYEIHRTLNKEEVGTYVRQRASQGDEIRFYACGGDGTICDVLNGMMGYENAQIAVYPCGTGNDFVRNFTNRDNFNDFKKLVSGDVIPCDVIRMNERYSLNMLNIGVDSDINEAAHDLHLKALGGASYAIAAVNVLSKHKLYRMKYEIDGQEVSEDLMLCAIANGKYCGGGFMSNPKAKLNDGMIDVCMVRPIKPFPKLMQMLLKYRKGEHLEAELAKPYIRYFQAPHFKLTPLCDLRVTVDGEAEDFRESDVECLHNAVKLALPEGCAMIDPA